MNLKHLRWALIGIFFLVGTLMGYKVYKELARKEKTELKQQVLSLKNIEYLKEDTKISGKPFLLSLFHPSCDFCQEDAKLLYEKRVLLKNLDIIWISYDDKDSIQKFSHSHGLDTIPNIRFAYMDIEAMLEQYGNVKFPTFLAYDKSGELIKKWVGLTQPQEILDAYNQEK
ncbi:TlpA family protein disulfide reductase [Roseivirga sp.]|uniref:TlpA family protein disulfide reductase n=1 Tax=Roseivirga sp. TaxID=1964215 RepID=UPI003B8BBD5F